MIDRMRRPRSWSIEHQVREDADSIFVPAELVPRAQPGDAIEIRSSQPTLTRHGHVVACVDDHERGRFVTVKLEAPTQQG
jgi:hypothetical protein